MRTNWPTPQSMILPPGAFWWKSEQQGDSVMEMTLAHTLLCQLYLYEVLLGKSLAAHCEKCRSAWLLRSPIYEQQHIFRHRCFYLFKLVGGGVFENICGEWRRIDFNRIETFKISTTYHLKDTRSTSSHPKINWKLFMCQHHLIYIYAL